MAAIGDDDALYIEGFSDAFDMIAGIDADGNFTRVLAVDGPPRVGGTPERQTEPAAGLRRTNEPRTLRLVRDRYGRDQADERDDLGWVRVPANATTGAPSSIRLMPAGRYLTVSRTDAAKGTDYGADTEMIAHSAADPADATRPVVTQARYWPEWDDTSEFGVAFGPDGVLMVRVERSMRD